MKDAIDVSDIDPAALLATLHNNTVSVGMGKIHDIGRDIRVEEAQEIIDERDGDLRFDYVKGRPIKVTIEDGSIRQWHGGRYDEHAHKTLEEVIEELRA